MKKKYVLQKDEKDCGVVCLYNIIKYYDGEINISDLRDKLKTDKDGTSIYNIVKVSNDLGLNTSAYECELNDLCTLQLPLIAYIKIDNKYNHFIIIDKIIDDEVYIFDPIRGYIKYEFDEFEKEFKNIVILFEKTKNIVKEKEDKFVKNIFDYVSKNSLIVLLSLILSFTISVISLVNSLYFSYLYENMNISFKILALFIFICIIKFLIDYMRNNIILKYTQKIDFSLTTNTYNKIISLPLNYHHSRPVGDIIARINDLASLKEFINTISFSLIIDVIYILLITTILFIMNKIIFFIFIIFVILYILVYCLFRSTIKRKSLTLKEDISNINSNLVESLFGIDTIKNLNIENTITNKFRNDFNKFLCSDYSFNKTFLILQQLLDFISTMTSLITLFIAITLFKNSNISLSKVIIYNSLIISFFASLKNIISIDELFIQSKNSSKRLQELFNKKIQTSKTKKIKIINKISINQLNYSYNDLTNVVKNINFTINKNDYIFINGKSGSGKSTIFKLITKQLKCGKDMIKINDIDINDISNEDIINNICYVSQNEYIFTDTILNNIKVFKEAKEKDLQKVIKITGIDKILKSRNITLDFLLEENGHNISGGERQRILLARSLLQNKRILILDETMNELDIQNERYILEKIKKKYKLTLILISHRDNNSDLFNKVVNV